MWQIDNINEATKSHSHSFSGINLYNLQHLCGWDRFGYPWTLHAVGTDHLAHGQVTGEALS